MKISAFRGQTAADTYDAAGNLAGKDVSEGGGSPTVSCSYTFDGANRLRAATISGTPATYWYDQDGRRVKETVAGKTTWFMYDGLSVIAEFSDDKEPDSVIVPGVSRTRLDLHEPQTEYYLLDGLGSVAQLTDELGNITQEYFYDVFGAARNVKRDPFNRYRFVGLAHDDLTGLIYMNARWYEPGTGRFVSRDRVLANPVLSQTLNRYEYVGNSPVSLVDPSGLVWWNPLTWFSDDGEAASEDAESDAKNGEDTSDNSEDRYLTCRGKARIIKGNCKHIGREGGFPGTPITPGSVGVDPEQWGGKDRLTRRRRGQVSGTAGSERVSGISEVIGGESPIPGKNVREALREIYPGCLLLELPSAEDDLEVQDVTLRVPASLGCPQGTVEVK